MYPQCEKIKLALLLGVVFCLIGAGWALTGTASAETQSGNESVEVTPIDIETDRLSVNLHTQRTTVEHGESVVFIHSVTNYITNEQELNVQLILDAPSGSEVFSTSGSDEATGSQFTTTTALEPGEQENVQIGVNLNDPGTHRITGEVVYYFGNDQGTGAGREATVVVQQQPEPPTIEDKAISGITDLNHPLAVFFITVGIFLVVLIFSRFTPTGTQSIVVGVAAIVLILGVIIAGAGVLGLTFGDVSVDNVGGETAENNDQQEDTVYITDPDEFPVERCNVNKEDYAEDLDIDQDNLGWIEEGDDLGIYNIETDERIETLICSSETSQSEGVQQEDTEYITDPDEFPVERCNVNKEDYAEDLDIDQDNLGWIEEEEDLEVYNIETDERIETLICSA